MKTIKKMIRNLFAYLEMRVRNFLSNCKKVIDLRVKLMSDSVNRQFWIVKLFSLIGAGTVLYWTFLMVRATPYDMVWDDFKCFVEEKTFGESQAPAAFAATEREIKEKIIDEVPLVEKREEKVEEKKESPEEYKTPAQAEKLIRKIAEEDNFSDPDLLVRIAKAESRLNPKESNPNGNKPAESVDRGLFMINDYWHRNVTDEQAYDPVFSTKWAIKKINGGGISIWNPSRQNWDPNWKK